MSLAGSILDNAMRAQITRGAAAYRHGLALALQEAGMARPTGVGRAMTNLRMPIEGAGDWLTTSESA